jgi:hypothetical protein
VDHFPAAELEQIAPEAAGWSAEKLAQALVERQRL